MTNNTRRYDLDALRAVAMLLGIVLHGALSFVPGAGFIWGVQDIESKPWFGVLLSSIHGWRMPLFFLVSGFFTAMLWKKRGIWALLKHRSLRILLPLVIGMCTIVPLNWVVNFYVRANGPEFNPWTPVVATLTEAKGTKLQTDGEEVDIFTAVVLSDVEQIERYIERGGDLEKRDPSGSTPLQVACLFGRDEAAITLIRAGADLEATNDSGDTVASLLELDWKTTAGIAGMFRIPIVETELLAGRSKIIQVLNTEFQEESPFSESVGEVEIFAAVCFSNTGEVLRYIAEGGDLNKKDSSGSTPLHLACLFGRSDAAIALIRAGADPDAKNIEGETPEDLLKLDWGTTSWIAGKFEIPVQKEQLFEEREKIASVLEAEYGRKPKMARQRSEFEELFEGINFLLFYLPVWHHLWFLYFLCWFVGGFAIIVSLATGFKLRPIPRKLITGWWRYLWLIPLTSVLQFFMVEPDGFGPDTSLGLLPLPAVFIYYAIFFGYGALYFSSDDEQVAVGRWWWLKIAIGLAIVFPMGLTMRASEGLLDRVLFSIVQVSFAWLMTFGLLGLFYRFFSTNRPWVRYLSDASYWMYLIHIPFIVLVQYWVSRWQFPASLKFAFVCTFTTIILLMSYQALVRWTYIGLLLNGRMVPWKKPNG